MRGIVPTSRVSHLGQSAAAQGLADYACHVIPLTSNPSVALSQESTCDVARIIRRALPQPNALEQHGTKLHSFLREEREGHIRAREWRAEHELDGEAQSHALQAGSMASDTLSVAAPPL